MQAAKIILLSVLAAVAYGVVHDQVTARVCVEYFTVGHPPVFATESPTVLGLGWGVIATWWAGLIVGVPLAAAARAGRRVPATAAAVVRPLACLMGVMATLAAAAGGIAFALGRRGTIRLLDPLAGRVAVDHHAAFLADAASHLASYAVGFVGGAALCGWVWVRRPRLPDGLAGKNPVAGA